MEYFIIARWLIVYAVLFVLGLPIAARLFPATRSRGAGLAIPIALLLISLPAYWIGQLPGGWGLPALVAGIVLLSILAGLAAIDLTEFRKRRAQMQIQFIQTLHPNRWAVYDTVLVFILSFAFIILIRAFDPAVIPVGGEKFLDFGLLKTLSRSSSLPPSDFWFAGEPVKYYYGGHLTTTLLAWLTETPPRFAYNIALAGYYATVVTAAFEISGTIAETNGHARRVAGTAGAFFVGIAGNLLTPARVVVAALPQSLEQQVVGVIAQQTDDSIQNIDTALQSFSYWDASRIIDGTINEFPLFAWLNGDLHAHMLSTQTLLLAVGLGYAYYRTPESQRRRRQALVFGAIPLTAAWQAVQNTWSFPSVIAVGGLAILITPAQPVTLFPWYQKLRRGIVEITDTAVNSYVGQIYQESTRIGWTIGITIVSGGIAAGFAAPFLFDTAAGSGQRSIELLEPAMRSSIAGLFLVHGAFVVGIGGYLYTRIVDEVATDSRSRTRVFAGVILAVVVFTGLIWLLELPVVIITLPVLIAAWIGARVTRTVGYEAVLIIGGAGLITLVEIIYLNEQAGPGRMNTVFKTYAQVWVLWATAMGVAIPGLRQRNTVLSNSSTSTVEQSSAKSDISAATTQTDSPISRSINH
jgi:Chlor_Arch_YYY domain